MIGMEKGVREASGEGHLKWLYEHVVERVPGLSRLPARTSVLIQLLLMEALGLGLGRGFGVEPMVLGRGSLLIIAVALWSELLLVVAPRLRSQEGTKVTDSRLETRNSKLARAGVLSAYRWWLFHPWHLEAVPGMAMFVGCWIMLLVPQAGGVMAIEEMLGRSVVGATHAWLLLLPVVLLSWDVCYRLGVGLWVAGFSAWRSVALWRLVRYEVRSGHILSILGLKWSRRMDRTLLLFPLTSGLVMLLFVSWESFFYHLGGVTAATAGLGVVALGFDGACLRGVARWGKGGEQRRTADYQQQTGRRGSRGRGEGLGPLREGARVAIIGAGPAGSLCAHFLSRLAREEGRELHVTLFDYKDFSLSGPRGCNMCAGVIPGSLSRHLEEAEICLPPQIVQSYIGGYRIVTQAGEACLWPPAGGREIVTVFRGNGPKYAPVKGNVSFDDFLLENARRQGVEVVEEAVRGLSLPGRRGEPVVITYGHGGEQQQMEAEAVVGAFGLSGNMPSLLKGLGFGYEPPQSLRACQAEVRVGAEHISRVGGEQIVVFSLGLKGITFAALTPKKEHFTVTLVGRRPVKIPDLVAFLGHPRVREFLPQDWEAPPRLCHCHPLVAVKGARAPFADRLVVIGDASYCRYFKNGLESAFHTALFAARTMVHHGISRESFREHYYPFCRREIIRDNRYGKLLFALHERVASSSLVAQAQMSLFQGGSPAARAFQRAAWDLFTGERPYRWVAAQLARPGVALRLLSLMAKRAWGAR